jgi:hypothetical protein
MKLNFPINKCCEMRGRWSFTCSFIVKLETHPWVLIQDHTLHSLVIEGGDVI